MVDGGVDLGLIAILIACDNPCSWTAFEARDNAVGAPGVAREGLDRHDRCNPPAYGPT
jgi:hypothetical protein